MSEHGDYDIDYGDCYDDNDCGGMEDWRVYRTKEDTTGVKIAKGLFTVIAVTGKLAVQMLSLTGKAALGMCKIIEAEHKRRTAERIRREEETRKKTISCNDELLKEVVDNLNRVESVRSKMPAQTSNSEINQMVAAIKELRDRNISANSLDQANAVNVEIGTLAKSCESMRHKEYESYQKFLDMNTENNKRAILSILVVVTSEIDKLVHDPSRLFIEDEVALLNRDLKKIQSQVDDHLYDEAKSEASKIHKHLDSTISIFKRKKSVYLQYVAFNDKLKDIMVSKVIEAWVGDKIRKLQKSILATQGKIAHDKVFDENRYTALLLTNEQQLRLLLNESDEKQENELARQYLIRNIVEALKDAKMDVATPKLSGGRDGDVVLEASRSGRVRKQSLTMLVDHDCHIRMDSDGGDPNDVSRIKEAMFDKTKERNVACRQVKQEIMAFIAQKGFPLKEVRQEWHPPEKIAKGRKI
jgi:hypothetical protein